MSHRGVFVVQFQICLWFIFRQLLINHTYLGCWGVDIKWRGGHGICKWTVRLRAILLFWPKKRSGLEVNFSLWVALQFWLLITHVLVLAIHFWKSLYLRHSLLGVPVWELLSNLIISHSSMHVWEGFWAVETGPTSERLLGNHGVGSFNIIHSHHQHIIKETYLFFNIERLLLNFLLF